MNRRKFLNIGSISFIGLNSFGSFFTSFISNHSNDISSLLLREIGGRSIDVPENDITHSIIHNYSKSFLDLGYRFKTNSVFTNGLDLFVNLELKSNHKNYDEVLIIFNHQENTSFKGTLNKRQMQLLLAYKSDITDFGKKKSVNLGDYIIPLNHDRWIENGYSFYETKYNKIGFLTRSELDSISTSIKVKDLKDHLFLEGKNVSPVIS